jgi:hypothetical protein
MIRKFLEVLNCKPLFLKLNRFICNWQPVMPVHWTGYFSNSTGSSVTSVHWTGYCSNPTGSSATSGCRFSPFIGPVIPQTPPVHLQQAVGSSCSIVSFFNKSQINKLDFASKVHPDPLLPRVIF